MSQENVSVFNDSKDKVFRTPVSLLSEICIKSICAPPVYKLIKEISNQNKKTFIYNCYLNENLQANGESNTKQKAKHVAALNVLNKLKEANVGVNNDLATKLESMINCLSKLDLNEDLSNVLSYQSSSSSSSSMLEENGLNLTNIQYDCKDKKCINYELIRNEVMNCDNPISELMDLASQYSIRNPEFIIENEIGPPHNKQFLCVGKFGDLKESGLGRTKKLAKRFAAYRLLLKAKLSHKFNQNPKNIGNLEKIEDSKGDIFSQLKSSKHTAMNLLITRDLQEISNRIFLDQLAREENFKYDVYKVPTNKNEFQAYVIQLNTSPKLLYGGYGTTQKEAVNNAIYFTLNNIKDVCVGKNF